VKVIRKDFYVYVYLDPLKRGHFYYKDVDLEFEFEPFYVGKGCGRRYLSHLGSSKSATKNENRFKRISRIRQASETPIVLKVLKDVTENESLAKEVKIIHAIGRKNINTGPLTNLSGGGEGAADGERRRIENIGMTYEDYYSKVGDGLHYCTSCKEWKKRDENFTITAKTCKKCIYDKDVERRRKKIKNEILSVSDMEYSLDIMMSKASCHHRGFAEESSMTLIDYLNLISKGLKYCSSCKIFKMCKEFNNDKSSYDGLSCRCRDCAKNNQKYATLNVSKKREMDRGELFSKIAKKLAHNIKYIEILDEHTKHVYNICRNHSMDYMEYAKMYSKDLRLCFVCKEWKCFGDMCSNKKRITSVNSLCRNCRSIKNRYKDK